MSRVSVGETVGVPFLLRDATREDLPRLREVFRRASLSNEGDRAVLIEHPDVLVFAPTSQFGARVRVATAALLHHIRYSAPTSPRTTESCTTSIDLSGMINNPSRPSARYKLAPFVFGTASRHGVETPTLGVCEGCRS
jgi:hypothetical protein